MHIKILQPDITKLIGQRFIPKLRFKLFDCSSKRWLTNSAFQVVDFSATIFTGEYRLFMSKQIQRSFNMTTFFEVLSPSFWKIIIGLFFALSGILFFVLRSDEVSFHFLRNQKVRMSYWKFKKVLLQDWLLKFQFMLTELSIFLKRFTNLFPRLKKFFSGK